MKIIKTRIILAAIGVLILLITVAAGFGIAIRKLIYSLEDKWVIPVGIAFVIFCFAVMYAIEKWDENHKKRKKTDLFEPGKLIFQSFEEEFVNFYQCFLMGKKAFAKEYQALLKEQGYSDPIDMEPVEVLYVFAQSKESAYMIDWRGEDEGEIQEFVEGYLKQKIVWDKTEKLRAKSGVDQHDGEFIIPLFKAIDKDLQTIDQRLLFFDLGSDAYFFTVIDAERFKKVMHKSIREIHGVGKL